MHIAQLEFMLIGDVDDLSRYYKSFEKHLWFIGQTSAGAPKGIVFPRAWPWVEAYGNCHNVADNYHQLLDVRPITENEVFNLKPEQFLCFFEPLKSFLNGSV